MQITEVRIKLMEEPGERLRAFCSLTFDDCFVIRDLKIIEGTNGPFVAMPSRKLTAHCPQCGYKNHLRAGFCNQCGLQLKEDRTIIRDDEGRAKLYADIAHPINSACREMIQARVVAEFQAEQERARQPGYTSRYDDYFDQEEIVAHAHHPPRREQSLRPGSESATQVQPPEPQPRGPHKTPAPATPRQPPSSDAFGAGVF